MYAVISTGGKQYRVEEGATLQVERCGDVGARFIPLTPGEGWDAMENPDKYPQLTIRVSGYAVNFVRLTREQQQDIVTRSFFQGSL